MFKDNKLRLLMSLAGFERLGIDDEPGATWIIPSTLSARELSETQETVEKHRETPIREYGDEDPVSAEEMLRRASAYKTRRAEYDDDSDGDGIVSDDEEEFLYPAGGPTNTHSKSSALEELKRKRRKRRAITSGDEGEGLDDETREARREARRQTELEKRRKIKSNEFVRDTDEESDEELDREFFAREELRRKGQAEKVLEALRAGRVSTVVEGRKRKIGGVDDGGGKKNKPNSTLSDPLEDDTSGNEHSPSIIGSRAVSVDSDGDSPGTPLSSPHLDASQETTSARETIAKPTPNLEPANAAFSSYPKRHAEPLQDSDEDMKEDNGFNPPHAPSGRARGRMILWDDSDEE